MWFLLLMLRIALGDPTSPQELEDRWRALQDLEVDTERWRKVERPLTVKQGPLAVRIESGILVPVFSGHFNREYEKELKKWKKTHDDPAPPPGADARGSKQFVGFVWTAGVGHSSLRFSDRADGLIFANHMVTEAGHPKEDMLSVAEGSPFVTTLSEGMFLSIDPELEAFFVDREVEELALEEGVSLEIVVYGDAPPPGSLVRARSLFTQRMEVLSTYGVRPGEWLAWDRLEESRGYGSATGRYGIIDVHTGHRYGKVKGRGALGVGEDQWITAFRDETGGIDPRRETVVMSLGRGPTTNGGRITGTPFPPSDPEDPLSAPIPPRRIEPDIAHAWVYAEPGATTFHVQIQVDATFKAVGGTFHHFQIDLPRVNADRKTFELVSATLKDGTPVVGKHPLLEDDPGIGIERESDGDDEEPEDPPDRRPGVDPDNDGNVDDGKDGGPDEWSIAEPDQRSSRLTVLLPEPLEEGETVTLRLHWKDTWPMANQVGLGTSNWATTISLGVGSGLRRVLPSVAGGLVGNPWKFTLSAYLPDDRPFSAALSGKTIGEGTEGDWKVFKAGYADERVPFAFVSLGRWREHDEPAAEGFPAVRIHMNRASDELLHAFAQETRRVIHFYQGFLPPFPWSEQETFEAPSFVNASLWIAGHGLTNVTRTKLFSQSATPSGMTERHRESRIYAHELAHQYWGHLVRPANQDDFWIAETFAEAYACLYVEAAFQDGSCGLKLADNQAQWERMEAKLPGSYTRFAARASLSEAYSLPTQPQIVYGWGPVVFHRMLRGRIGITAYHGALDLLVADHQKGHVTSEQVEQYLSMASQRELGDFFDYWVYGGYRPKLELEWWTDDKGTHGVVTSDVPFGIFDVPVSFGEADTDPVWVVVKNGEGRFDVDRDGEPLLDALKMTMARKRITRRRE